jgi:hypothetical protein
MLAAHCERDSWHQDERWASFLHGRGSGLFIGHHSQYIESGYLFETWCFWFEDSVLLDHRGYWGSLRFSWVSDIQGEAGYDSNGYFCEQACRKGEQADLP